VSNYAKGRADAAALSIKVFGTYMVVSGIGLTLIPNLWLAPFGFPHTGEIWVRVVGIVVGVLGFYYWTSALSNARSFFVATIYGRCIFCAGCIGLVLLASAPGQLLIFGFIDLAGAVWTKLVLNHESLA
jgi:hypothetical protein